MKATSSTEVMMAPQRRRRGIRIRAPPKVSAMPSASVNGRLIQPGSRNSSINRDQTIGLESFHPPLVMKISAIKTPATWLATFFQGGISRERPGGPAVVLASIYTLFYLFGQAH